MKLYFILIFVMFTLNITGARAQSICDSLGFDGEQMFVVMVYGDEYFPEIQYWGKNFLNYTSIKVELHDTSEVALRDSFTLFGLLPEDTIQLPFHVTYKTDKPYVYVLGGIQIKDWTQEHKFDCSYGAYFIFRRPPACDSIVLATDPITVTHDNKAEVDVVFTGNDPIVYPRISLVFDDTTDMVVRQQAFPTFLQDTTTVSFDIISKTLHVPDSLTAMVVIDKPHELYCVKLVTVYFDKASGLSRLDSEPALSLYPNPVTGNLLTVFVKETGTMSLRDMTGKIILQRTLIKGENKVVVPKVRAGQYIISYQVNEGPSSSIKISIPR